MKIARPRSALVRFTAIAIVSLALFAVFAFVGHAYQVGGIGVAILAVLGANAGLGRLMGHHRLVLGPTLTTTPAEILMDVIESFYNQFPALNLMGTDFQVARLKLGASYIAHISVDPVLSTYDANNGGYKNGVQSARSLLVDLNILVDDHPTCPLKWEHLNSIKDNKVKYEKAIAAAGRKLAQRLIDRIAAGFTQRNFTNNLVITVANFDYDALSDITTQATSQKMGSSGRVLYVSSAYAATLGNDERMNSALFAGQMQAGEGIRQWRNIGGFALIQEYPDLGTNNGAEVTGVTAEADDNILTKAAHGFETGDPVTFVSGTGFTGLTVGVKYFAIKLSSSTFKLATTWALAVAGTAIDITVDGSVGVFQLTEDIDAICFEARAFSVIAGIPDGFNSEMMAQLGVVQVMTMEAVTHPETKITMAAVSWQEAGTGDLIWCPTYVNGLRLGREGVANAAGGLTDRAGLRISRR